MVPLIFPFYAMNTPCMGSVNRNLGFVTYCGAIVFSCIFVIHATLLRRTHVSSQIFSFLCARGCVAQHPTTETIRGAQPCPEAPPNIIMLYYAHHHALSLDNTLAHKFYLQFHVCYYLLHNIFDLYNSSTNVYAFYPRLCM